MRDVQNQTRLPHRGAGSHDDEVTTLQPARHLVEVDEARGDACDEPLLFEQLLDLREAVLHQIAHRDEAGFQPIVGDGEDRALGLVQDQVRFLFGLVRVRDDLARRVDQISKRRLLFDDARVVLDVGRARDTVGKRRHVRGPAYLVEFTCACKLLFQRDEIDRIVPLVERDHAIEDATMRIPVEVLTVDDLRCEIERVVVDENRAEHRTFGFEIVRKRALRRGKSSIGHEETKNL